MTDIEKNTNESDLPKSPPLEMGKVVYHVMPERFRGAARVSVGNHRNAGFLVLIIGLIFLIALVGALYFFIFYKKSPSVSTENTAPVQEETKKPAADTSTEIKKLSENKVSPASSTPLSADSTSLRGTTAATSTISASSSVVTETDASSSVPVEVIPTPAYVVGADSDGDSLGNAEEVMLGTDVNLVDSDGDTFGDKAELEKLFNPAGKGKLSENSNITEYKDSTWRYRLLIPKLATTNQNNEANSIIFRLTDNDSIQIIREYSASTETLSAWYKSKLNYAVIPDSLIFFKTGWDAYKSQDGLTAYLKRPGATDLFIINYIPNSDKVLEYQNIFNVVVNSLEMIK